MGIFRRWVRIRVDLGPGNAGFRGRVAIFRRGVRIRVDLGRGNAGFRGLMGIFRRWVRIRVDLGPGNAGFRGLMGIFRRGVRIRGELGLAMLDSAGGWGFSAGGCGFGGSWAWQCWIPRAGGDFPQGQLQISQPTQGLSKALRVAPATLDRLVDKMLWIVWQVLSHVVAGLAGTRSRIERAANQIQVIRSWPERSDFRQSCVAIDQRRKRELDTGCFTPLICRPLRGPPAGLPHPGTNRHSTSPTPTAKPPSTRNTKPWCWSLTC